MSTTETAPDLYTLITIDGGVRVEHGTYESEGECRAEAVRLSRSASPEDAASTVWAVVYDGDIIDRYTSVDFES